MQVANFQELQGLKSVVKLILKCKNKHHIRKNYPQPNICLTMSFVSMHPNYTSTTTSKNNLTSQKPLDRHLNNKEDGGFDLLATSQTN